jgi:hypothetical protein
MERLARIRLTFLCQGGQVKMPSASLARPGSIPLGPWQHGYRQGISIEKMLVQIQPLAHVGGQKCRKMFVWIKSYARVAQRQSSLHTICVPCPPGINSLMGRDSMVTEREGGWFESSPWRLGSHTLLARIAQWQSNPFASLAHTASPFGPWQDGYQVVGSTPTPGSWRAVVRRLPT